MPEIWDIYSKYRQKTGRTILRGETLKEGEYYLVVDVWIRNSAGKYLITKRTPNKTFPNLWTTTGGAAIKGDDSLQAALREVKEEIGIKLNPDNGKHLLTKRRTKTVNSSFKDIWLFAEDVDITNVIHQPEEVSASRWASRKEIITMLENGEFVPVLCYFKDLF